MHNNLYPYRISCRQSWQLYRITEFRYFTRKQNHWHAAEEQGQSAKCRIILCSSVACAGDKSKRRATISAPLTLYSLSTVYTGSRPSDVQTTALSCQVHLLLSARKSIHLLCKLVKTGLQVPVTSNINGAV